jgi:branched-subunit amino acid transport protein
VGWRWKPWPKGARNEHANVVAHDSGGRSRHLRAAPIFHRAPGKDRDTLVAVQALRFVPVAILTAVVIPLLLYDDGDLEISLGNERLVAGLVAALICWRTRSALLTLVGGMAMLWTLQTIGQSL